MEVQENQPMLSFARVSGKQVEADFDAPTSDVGMMLLRDAASKTGILSPIVAAFTDRRHPGYVDHTIADLIHQRLRPHNGLSNHWGVKVGRTFLSAGLIVHLPEYNPIKD